MNKLPYVCISNISKYLGPSNELKKYYSTYILSKLKYPLYRIKEYYTKMVLDEYNTMMWTWYGGGVCIMDNYTVADFHGINLGITDLEEIQLPIYAKEFIYGGGEYSLKYNFQQKIIANNFILTPIHIK